MVSKTDDIPASVPNCNVNTVDLAEGETPDHQETKAPNKDPCACGKKLANVT